MLQRKIREVIGCLRTLKTANSLVYYTDDDDAEAARNLETDCMVKLALLFPLLPEGEFPEAVTTAMKGASVDLVEIDRVRRGVVFRRRNGYLVDVDWKTGSMVRRDEQTIPDLWPEDLLTRKV